MDILFIIYFVYTILMFIILAVTAIYKKKKSKAIIFTIAAIIETYLLLYKFEWMKFPFK